MLNSNACIFLFITFPLFNLFKFLNHHIRHNIQFYLQLYPLRMLIRVHLAQSDWLMKIQMQHLQQLQFLLML
jgi:hypothetical protein